MSEPLMNLNRKVCLGILFSCFVSLVGCGKSGEFETALVSGKVTLDGQPVTKGTVIFQPLKGKKARGSIGADGSFTLGTYGSTDGATIGSHRVIIVSREGGIEEDTTPIYLVPRHYGFAKTSGLTFEVLPDVDNSKMFELTSKGPRQNE